MGYLSDFIQERLKSAGRQKLVVGLSGGIDSAVAAALAAEAIGPKNIRAYYLPYKTSAPESLDDAREAADAFDISLSVIDISPIVDPYIDSVPDMNAVRRGNVMARARMMILFDRAHADALVLGTGNKTEALLGYTTLFGDNACSLNPLGDIYKTEIRRMAEYLQIPESIQKKKPTADLWPGQTDEEELGLSYEEVDRLLVRMVDEKASRSELLKEEFAPEFITKVRDLIVRNIFKRQLIPVAWASEPYSTKHLESPEW